VVDGGGGRLALLLLLDEVLRRRGVEHHGAGGGAGVWHIVLPVQAGRVHRRVGRRHRQLRLILRQNTIRVSALEVRDGTQWWITIFRALGRDKLRA